MKKYYALFLERIALLMKKYWKYGKYSIVKNIKGER